MVLVRRSGGVANMNGMLNIGNLFRYKKVLEKAESGQDICVGFIGGSITKGASSSADINCYAYLVWRWWVRQFPDITVHYINAGIGATTSQFGVARVERDLLVFNPDVVFVEFGVNDEGNEFFKETYEGLIRRIYSWKSCPAIILINNMYYDTGKTAQEFHNQVGIAYQLPIISIKESLYKDIQRGKYSVHELTNDMLHPNDFGHQLIARIICEFLEELQVLSSKEWDQNEIPEPITRNRFENSYMINSAEVGVVKYKFESDLRESADTTDVFKRGWYADVKGAYIECEVVGTNIAIQYRKSIKKPVPFASVFIDDCNVAVLDGNFEEEWGDCLFLQTVAMDLEKGNHKVHIEIMDVDEENITPFYIVSLIVS